MRMALVTGGGFIGSHLAAALAARGGRPHPRQLRDRITTEPGRVPRIEVMEGDLRDPSAVGRAVEGVEVVFHQGALGEEGMPLGPRSPYAVSKLAGEYYCRVFSKVYGFETVSLRNRPVPPRFDPPRPGDVKHSQAAIDRARQILGYVPVVSFEEGRRRTVEWFQVRRDS